jgi:uncharacterized protein (TIGR00661 family)
MKVLYAIQGTGNGHLSRAMEIIPLLRKRCETDILISGYQADLTFPFDVKYRLKGLSFIFGSKGGVDIRKTYQKANTKRLLLEIGKLPVKDYDFILNDFEPVSAWACYRHKVPCVALSHQAALLDKNTPKPRTKDTLGSFILRNYAPASFHVGIHFSRYSNNMYTPVLRKEIRTINKSDEGYYLVYLPAYDDKALINVLGKIEDVNWKVFSKHSSEAYSYENIEIQPVNNEAFLTSLASCKGVLCGAGFETPAESLFLGKKLMVIPMQGQYEQQYNAAALKGLGVPVIRKLKVSNIDKIKDWIQSDYRVEISYPDTTDRIINRIFEMFVAGDLSKPKWKDKYRIMPTKKEAAFH